MAIAVFRIWTLSLSSCLLFGSLLWFPAKAWSLEIKANKPANYNIATGKKTALLNTYKQLLPLLQKNTYDAPIYMQSATQEHSTHGEIFALMPHSYEILRKTLSNPQRWCEAIILHINVKSCVKHNGNGPIRTYLGYKDYQDPEESVELDYFYSVVKQENDYTHILLQAEYGPYGTSNYRLHAEFIPIDKNNSFIYFSYSLEYGAMARFVINTYLATFGRNKVGFSLINPQVDGEPQYIGGVKGIVERNAMRYFLAIQSYFDTLGQPTQKRYRASLNRWFDFTEKYRRQLYELDRIDYLAFKQKELENQIELQQKMLKKASLSSTPIKDPESSDF